MLPEHDPSRTLTRGQFSVPDAHLKALDYVLERFHWSMYPLFAIMLAPGVMTFFYKWPMIGEGIALAESGATLLILIWAHVWWYLRPYYEMNVDGVEINVEYGTYWAPDEEFQVVLDRLKEIYQEAGLLSKSDASEVLEGVIVDIVVDPPVHPIRPMSEFTKEQLEPDEDEEPRELEDPGDTDTIIGMAWPNAGYAIVYGPYAVRLDAFGFECSHFLDHDLWPGQGEGADLRVRKQHGVRMTWDSHW